MSSYNKVLLMGNLTRDPEIKTIGSGSTLANLSLAVNRRYLAAGGEKREEVTYVDIAFWGKQAEIFGRLNVRKGTPLFIEGRLQLDTWEDKQSGQKRSKLRVVGESFQLVGGKREGGPAGGHGGGASVGGGGRSEPSRSNAQSSDESPYYQNTDGDEPF